MHFLVSLQHPPQTCALRSPESKAAGLAFLTDADGTAAGHGVTIEQVYVDTVGHEQFLGVEAASAGDVEAWLLDAGIALSNTLRIRPVRTLDETAALFTA